MPSGVQYAPAPEFRVRRQEFQSEPTAPDDLRVSTMTWRCKIEKALKGAVITAYKAMIVSTLKCPFIGSSLCLQKDGGLMQSH